MILRENSMWEWLQLPGVPERFKRGDLKMSKEAQDIYSQEKIIGFSSNDASLDYAYNSPDGLDIKTQPMPETKLQKPLQGWAARDY